jgi:hypothetical protein
MVYGAIDLHMRYSQIRIIDESGVVLRDQRIVTVRGRRGHRENIWTAFRPFEKFALCPRRPRWLTSVSGVVNVRGLRQLRQGGDHRPDDRSKCKEQASDSDGKVIDPLRLQRIEDE